MDVVAALATGAVGSVAPARSDICDTLTGVAIAISPVPPLAVVGLTLESGAPRQSLLRRDLNAASLDGLDVRVNLVSASYQPVPK